jgi:predicted amidophosphoribosyltransferase
MTGQPQQHKLHPTWKRKLRLIMFDNPACMCPYCGEIAVYWDGVCDKCEREILPCGEGLVDG